MSTIVAEPTGFIGKSLQPFAELCYDRAKTVIVLTIIALTALLPQILNIPIDVSTEGMLHKNDPARLAYNEFKATFGRDDVIILSLPVKDKMDSKFFSQLHELQQKLENTIAHVQYTTSLINARVTKSEDDELVVEDLLEGWTPRSNISLDSEVIQSFVLAQPPYLDRLVSRDGKYTAILVNLAVYGSEKDAKGNPLFLDPMESQHAVKSIKTLVAEYPELDIALGGKPVILNIINTNTFRDSSISGTAAIFISMLFMMVFFRRLSGVLLPLVVICGSMVAAMGIMGITRAPFTLTIGSVFPLMVAVGVADAVHILTHFYRNYEEVGDKRSAIIQAICDSGPAVLMTSLTTAVGFLSFTAGDLASTADLGIYAAIAVLFALYFTLILLPSCIALFDIKRLANNRGLNHKLDAFLSACGNLACNFPRAVSLFGIGLMILCIWGTSFLYFYYDPISRFPDHVVEKTDNSRIDKAYYGITPIEVIINTRKPRGVLNEAFLTKLEEAEQRLAFSEHEGLQLESTYSVLTILREVHKAINNNDPEAYIVTKDPELAAQELLLFELNDADDLRDVIDYDLQTVRLSLSTHHADGVQYARLIANIEEVLDGIFGQEVDITITGTTALMAASVPKALQTMAKSYIVAAILIILMMMLMVRNIKIGLISIVPNLLPILLVMNVMVVMGWPLDMTTILVGAIAMGIVVDDTLHFLYHFKQNFEVLQSAKTAVHATLKSTGPALFITTIIFSTGAGGNMLSAIENIFIFGFTMWLVTILALLADILIAPALLVWAFGEKQAAE